MPTTNQQLYDDTMHRIDIIFEQARDLNNDARIAWLKEVQQKLDSEVQCFQDDQSSQFA